MAVGFHRMAILLVVVAASWRCSFAATYIVGDSLGWVVPPNTNIYSEWASNRTFAIGDTLVFNFASERHDVTEVTKTAYDSCIGTNPISTENNSPARITLTSAGERHFICTVPGHCINGQKLSITVKATSTPSPQPSSPSPSPVSVPRPSIAPEPSSARSPSPGSSSPSPSLVSIPRPSIAPEPSSFARSPSQGPSSTPSSPPPSTAGPQSPSMFVVGDSLGWSVPSTNPSFYNVWARDKVFTVGDILEFNFMNRTHNVAKVTKSNFGSCSGESPISTFSDSPVRITLSDPGEHFFICTFPGHCSAGQKLAVTVTAASAPSADTVPSTPTPPSAAPTLRASAFSAALLAVAVALVY